MNLKKKKITSSQISKSPVSIWLVNVSGADVPGITAELTEILARHNAVIMDLTQAVIQKLLSLSLLFQVNSESEVIRELQQRSSELHLKLEFSELDPAVSGTETERSHHHYCVTLIAESVSARALSEVTRVLARWNLNIDVIKKLSENHFGCVEMLVSSVQVIAESVLRKELLGIAKAQSVDIALQAEGLFRRSKRLVVLDMDSTLIQGEVIDELARVKGVYEQVSQITGRAMQGQMDFDESLRLRCDLLRGLSSEDLLQVYEQIEITPGAEDLIRVLKRLGYKTAVISGGFSFVADRLREKLGIDFSYSNTLEVLNGQVTGRVLSPIVNAQRKADLLEVIAQQEKIVLDQVIAIGDGANDLLMLEKAGLGIAFHAKPVVREKADLAFSQKNMRSILYLLGLSARDVAQAVHEEETRA
jgi:phosphoserine phosphatase